MFDENAIKQKVLEEIAQFLDGKLGDSLKGDGPKVLDVQMAAKGEPDGDEDKGLPDLGAPDAPGDDGPVDDEDAKKLLELARLGKGR